MDPITLQGFPKFFDLPQNVMEKICVHLPYSMLKVLRLVSINVNKKINEDARFFDRSIITIPYESLQRPATFQTAIQLLKKLRPTKKLTISFPPKKPGTVLFVLIGNILAALFANVMNEAEANCEMGEPIMQILSKDWNFEDSPLQISFNFSQPNDLKNSLMLSPYKIWNTICLSDPRLYEVMIKRTILEMKVAPNEEAFEDGSNELKLLCVHIFCQQSEIMVPILGESLESRK
ncbi:hypothetical protein Fcan01_10768, partial [Folsomia candida]